MEWPLLRISTSPVDMIPSLVLSVYDVCFVFLADFDDLFDDEDLQ